MTKVKLKCSNCGKEFERSKSEAARNEKIGRRVYCSLECNGHSGHAHLAPYKGVRSPNFIRCNDGLSSMRFHLKIIRWHCKKKGWIPEITLEDLKEQWDKQGGVCPYTGWVLQTPKNTAHYNQLGKTPDRASLDRIDSSKGYVRGNIQFVSLIVQYAKNGWDDVEVLKLCKAVVDFRKL